MLVPATKTPTATTAGGSGYSITFCALNATGNPTVSDDNLVISGTGPYAGMTALQTPYQIDVTAKTATGGEVHLIRTMQAVAIPVFQFGIFSDSDLSFFAAETFGFGGRIHTNGNLWMAEGTGQTLTTNGKITAVGDVVRQFMSNGIATSLFMNGTVSLATSINSPTGNRNMTLTEGSVNGTAGSAANPNWQTISLGATGPTGNYNGFIKNSATGAKKLSLPITATGVGGSNIDIVRRPCISGAPAPCTGTADDTASILYNERLFTKASIRILLSDTAADISNIPGVTATPPVLLDNDWRTTPPTNGTAVLYGTAGGGVDATHAPIARSLGQTGNLTQTTAGTTAGTSTTINLLAVPAIMQNPPLRFKNAAGANPIGPVTCTGRTLNTFTGCTHALVTTLLQPMIYVSTAAPPTAPTVGSMPGTTPAATLGSNSLLNLDITLAAGSTTLGFAQNTFFINDVASGGTGISTPVTCTGLTGTQLTGCTGVPTTKSGATITTGYVTPVNTGTIGGYLKIEKASNATPPVWTDITMEILNYGIGLTDPLCNLPASNNAIVQLQRPRNNNAATCSIGDITNSYEWWPNSLFDTREGTWRDQDPGTFTGGTLVNNGLPLQGVIYYVGIDVKNLAKWFNAVGPYVAGTGGGSKTDNGGYTVYFSDRRNNRNATNLETGEFGYEDFVNPGVVTGLPDGACNAGEDVNGNTTCETYGQYPSYNGTYNAVAPGTTQVSPLIGAGSPTSVRPTTLVKRGIAQVNRPVFFRRALKLINGGTINSDATVANRISGLTVVSENPVYIQGDWNAVPATWGTAGELHAATAVIADAVTLLSNLWDDDNGFTFPYTYPASGGGGRLRSNQSYYRVAVLGGKGVSFPLPSDVSAATGGVSVFGTDGGPHNFLRMIEQDGSAAATNTVNYRGSMASLYYNRQGVGTFKCCSTNATDGIVYSVPVRNFFFDTDFLQPALLPPNTPMFRDINVIGFSQELRPGK